MVTNATQPRKSSTGPWPRTQHKLTCQPESSAEEFKIPGGISNSSFVTGWHYMPGFSGKKIQNDQIRTE